MRREKRKNTFLVVLGVCGVVGAVGAGLGAQHGVCLALAAVVGAVGVEQLSHQPAAPLDLRGGHTAHAGSRRASARVELDRGGETGEEHGQKKRAEDQGPWKIGSESRRKRERGRKKEKKGRKEERERQEGRERTVPLYYLTRVREWESTTLYRSQ